MPATTTTPSRDSDVHSKSKEPMTEHSVCVGGQDDRSGSFNGVSDVTSEMNGEISNDGSGEFRDSNDETMPRDVLPSLSNEGSQEDGTNDETGTSAEKGMRCESKRLYEKLEYGDTDWVEEIPADIKAKNEAAIADSKISPFALILRTQFSNGKAKLHSIVVQSPVIREALKDILRDYPGIFLGKDPLIFTSPF